MKLDVVVPFGLLHQLDLAHAVVETWREIASIAPLALWVDAEVSLDPELSWHSMHDLKHFEQNVEQGRQALGWRKV